MMILVSLVNFLILIICVLIGVAFLTLLERKILGYIQIRKGPNKIGYMGLFQPFSDAIKLFSKEQNFLNVSNFCSYYMSPILSLFVALLIWCIVPYSLNILGFYFGILFFFSCTSIGVYTVMMAGWSSNSKYASLGGLRAAAQTISYEVSLAFILLSFIFLIGSFNMIYFYCYQDKIWFGVLSMPLMFIWFSSCLAETNRTPFDFAEGESELVSGFNTEFSSGGFALIFMAEYASILFMSMLSSTIFLGGMECSYMFYLKLLLLSFLFIWVRGTLPRFRYDKLMNLAWKSFLPVSLNYLMFFMGLKLFLMVT
nr:NADH dehydrogenase subunit 1 [Micraspides sp.]